MLINNKTRNICFIIFLIIFCNCNQENGQSSNSEKVDSAKIVIDRFKSGETLQISKIYFESSGCYGKCPIMNFEIDSNGVFKFNGIRFTKKIGVYSGSLNKELLLKTKNDLKTLYEDNSLKLPVVDDGQYYKLILTTNKARQDTFFLDTEVGDRTADFLMNLYKKIELKDTELISKDK